MRRHAQLLLAAALSAAILTWLWLADAAAAAGTTPTPTPGKGEDTPLNLPTDASGGTSQDGSGSSLARTIVGLFVVIAVIYGVTWVLKQMKAAKEGDAYGAGLESSASLPLGTNRALHLVRAGNEWLLLGVTDGGIAPLRTYTEAEARAAGLPIGDGEIDALRPAPNPEPGQGPGAIVEHLRNLTVRR